MQTRKYNARRIPRSACGLALPSALSFPAGFASSIALGLTLSFATAPASANASGHASHAADNISISGESGSGVSARAQQTSLEASTRAAVEQLHHFQYDDANAIYRKILNERAPEPYRTRAYWGLLMSLNYPLWHEQQTAEARVILQQYESERIVPLAGRDNDLMQAVKHLYDPSEENKARRDNAYVESMEAIYRADPRNDDTASFFALALLAQSSTLDGDARMKGRAAARQILEHVYDRNPDHPGTLHYLIHAFDGGIASTHYGLGAATRYAKFGTSAHALHMPSHIFMPLGMWPEIIAGETKAWDFGKARAARIQKAQSLPYPSYDIHALHSLQWLHYAYLQTGNIGTAESLLNEMVVLHQADPNAMATWYLARMYATHLVETGATNPDHKASERIARQLANLNMDDIELSSAASRLYALGTRAAYKHGHAGPPTGQIDQAVRQRYLKEIIVQLERRIHSTNVMLAEVNRPQVSYYTGADKKSVAAADVMLLQLKGLSEALAGNKASAGIKFVAAAQAEQALPPSYGPPVPVKPASELLGEYYLLTDTSKSQSAFEAALRRNANRLIATQGVNGSIDRSTIAIE